MGESFSRISLVEAARRILSCVASNQVGADVEARTPERFADAWRELLAGYSRESELKKMLTSFEREGTQHLVAVSNIAFYSVCEHHLLPFFGRAHVGYIPQERIIGASKLPRLVEVYARRLQLQERMTHQIASALETNLAPIGVAVVIEGEHLCMAMRGVKKQSKLTTSEMLGIFRTDAAARSEFLSLVCRSGQ